METPEIGRAAIVKKYLRLLDNNEKGVLRAWIDFKAAVIFDYKSDAPVAEFALLPKTIEKNFSKLSTQDISILNHGCGTGVPDLYWVALGYSNLTSVDIFSRDRKETFKKLNELLKTMNEIKKDIFFIYDGLTLPLRKNQVDVVNSNAVVEHLSDEFYENYFSEQGRVLKENGIALHVIPQRLQPYDSHTQTWFVHWLPGRIQSRLIKTFGRYNPDLVLHLRSKFTHIKHIKKQIGEVDDRSIDYFMNSKVKKEDFYDSKTKRGLIFQISNLPVFKSFLPKILSYLLCLIVVSKKT